MSEQNHPPKTFTDFMRGVGAGIINPMVRLLAKTRITPNMLTIAGMLTHIPITWALMNGRWQLAALIGLGSFCDALDGSLARYLGTVGKDGGFGAFLDSTSDRIAETILYSGFIYYYAAQANPNMALLSGVAMGGSLMVSYCRAKAEADRFDCKIGIMSRLERYLLLFIFGILQMPVIALSILAVGTWFTVFQRVWYVRRQAMRI